MNWQCLDISIISYRSSFTSSQQTAVLELVMDSVSQKLGLREQLDIINIINPNAQLSPTDTEFFIGMFVILQVGNNNKFIKLL